MLAVLKRLGGAVGGAQVQAQKTGSAEDWVNLSFGASVLKSAEEIERLALELPERLGADGTPELTLNLARLAFPTGQALEEAARELGEPLKAGEVRQ